MSFRKLISLILVSAILLSTGCSFKNDYGLERLNEIPKEFIEALADEDENTIEEITNNYDYEADVLEFRNFYPNAYRIINLAISKAEIEELGEPILSEDKTSAKMDITISYINLSKFSRETSHFITLEDVTAALEEYTDRDQTKFTMKFVRDSKDDEWRLERKSAGKFWTIFSAGHYVLPEIVSITPEEAEEIFLTSLNDIAETATSSLVYNLDIEDWRGYDNVLMRGNDAATEEAYENFVKAYMTYVLSHNYTIEHDEYFPYNMNFSGVAPSNIELYQQFFTDEFKKEYYLLYFRVTFLGMDVQEMWNQLSALIYNTLADAIPDATPEPYSINGNVDAINGLTIDSPVRYTNELINEPQRGIYEFEHGASAEQTINGYLGALEELYEAGAITDEDYEFILPLITPETFGFTNPDTSVNSNGHPNQALGITENVPEFCTDGSLIYGYSNLDSNGFWMFYSKEPTVLNTVGYYIDEDGIWITNYFDEEFDEGTKLVVDWWYNGELVIDTEVITISEDGTTEIEVYLPTDGFPAPGEYEMRIWRESHSYVISYVILRCDE